MMSAVKSEKRSNMMIEEVSSSKEKIKPSKKKSKNDLNIQMKKETESKQSISLQTSKKKDQKG